MNVCLPETVNLVTVLPEDYRDVVLAINCYKIQYSQVTICGRWLQPHPLCLLDQPLNKTLQVSITAGLQLRMLYYID